jgi:hypothetical protein
MITKRTVAILFCGTCLLASPVFSMDRSSQEDDYEAMLCRLNQGTPPHPERTEQLYKEFQEKRRSGAPQEDLAQAANKILTTITVSTRYPYFSELLQVLPDKDLEQMLQRYYEHKNLNAMFYVKSAGHVKSEDGALCLNIEYIQMEMRKRKK